MQRAKMTWKMSAKHAAGAHCHRLILAGPPSMLEDVLGGPRSASESS